MANLPISQLPTTATLDNQAYFLVENVVTGTKVTQKISKADMSLIRPQGDQGGQGALGLQGYQGNQGDQSSVAGVQGSQGFQGSDGVQGYQGYQGNQGNQAALSEILEEVPTGTVGGGNVTFTVSTTPASDGLFLYKNGVLQKRGGSADYTMIGTTITFNTAPIAGDILVAKIITALSIGQQGPQGEQGNQGDQSSVAGVQGNQGDQGDQGYQGDQSSVAGAQGDQGDTGDMGNQGSQGPQGSQGGDGGNAQVFEMQIVPDEADVDSTVGIGYIYIPLLANNMVLTRAQAFVTTAGTTNATTIQVRNLTKYSSNDCLSSAISIASGDTVGTAGTVDTSYDDVSTNDKIKVYVTAQSTTKPKGLTVVLEYSTP